MRGYAFFLLYLCSLALIFTGPFNGVLVWYAFSLGNFHTLIWDTSLATLPYAYPIAILTCFSWLGSRREKKKLPLTPQVILTILFSLWMTITSFYALAPEYDPWNKWLWVQKMLLMCLVGFALTTTRERVNQLIWVVVLSIGFWGMKGAISFPLHGGGQGIHGPDGGITATNNEFGVALILVHSHGDDRNLPEGFLCDGEDRYLARLPADRGIASDCRWWLQCNTRREDHKSHAGGHDHTQAGQESRRT